MKNIFVSDIDGTLTNFGSPLLDSYGIKALQKASNLGEVILASGRPYRGIITMYSNEEFIIDYIIALNGGHILYKNKTIKTYPIPKEVINYFVNNQQQYVNLWLYTEDAWYATSLETEAYKKEERGVNFKALSLKEYNFQKVLKILIVDDGDINQLTNILRNKLTGVQITTSSDSYLEIFSLKINKYLAVKEITKDIDCRIFSFGDSNNDVEMIKNSFLGCAVNNAVWSIKEIAQYISTYDFGKGVYDSLTHIEKEYFTEYLL